MEPVRKIVERLVLFGQSTDKKVSDVLQSRSGGNSCSTRAAADGSMTAAWNANVTALSIQTIGLGQSRLWKTKELAKAQIDKVHQRAVSGEGQIKPAVTALTFNVADAVGSDSRFIGGNFHCVWLLDAGEGNDGRLYFVAYDQDVTCSVRAETKWRQLLGNMLGDQQKAKEVLVDQMKLNDPDTIAIINGMILNGDKGNELGPLIRFLDVIEG